MRVPETVVDLVLTACAVIMLSTIGLVAIGLMFVVKP